MRKRVSCINRKILFLCLFFIAFAAANAEKKIRVQLKWKHQFQFAGYYAAKENGYYEKEGMDVELLEYYKESPVDAVINGDAEFGIASSELILERAKGKKIVVLASIFQNSPYIFLAKKDSNIENMNKLNNKRIALRRDETELVLYLKKANVDIKRNEITNLSFSIEPLIDGSVDIISAYSTDEPFQLKMLGIDYKVFNPRDSGIDFYGDSIFTTEEFLQKNPELTAKFVKESIKGWEYALNNKKEIVEIILGKYSKRHSREHLIFEAEETEKLIMPEIVDIGYINKRRWEKTAKSYQELGLLPEKYSLEGFFYNENMEIKYHVIQESIKYAVFVLGLSVIGVIVIIIYIFKLHKEIKRRKKIEKELEEKEKKYKLLAENTVECIWLLGLKDMKFKYISPSIKNLRGLSVEEAMSESPSDSLTPESLKKVEEITEKRMKGFMNGDRSKEVIEGIDEFQQYRKDGTVIDVEISTKYIYNEEENSIYILGISRDITERKKLEKEIIIEKYELESAFQKISKSEKELRDFMGVLDRIPVGVIVTDVNGNITYVNRKVIDTSKFKKEEIIGKTPRIFKSGVQTMNFYNEMWKEVASGKEWSGELINETRDGIRYKEKVTIIPVKDDFGKIYSYLGLKEKIE